MSSTDVDAPLESPEALQDQELNPRRGAYFPRRFLTDFFDFLQQHRQHIEVLTYAELPWGDDWDYARNYPVEHRNWQKQLARGERDPSKAYLALQYDIDSRPERSMALLREPSHAGVPANVMIFNRRVDRRRLKNSNELGFTEYELDWDLLTELGEGRFLVGYHTNAYEQAHFVTERALEIFDRDVKELSQRFDIRFFSAHGGVQDPEGKNNRDLPFHPHWRTKLRWVHNGYSIRFDGQFSDGGHNSLSRDPAGRDLRAFVSQMRRGKRYRVLLHPQYYDVLPRPSPRFSGTPWYDELMLSHERADKASFWSDVRLGAGFGI